MFAQWKYSTEHTIECVSFCAYVLSCVCVCFYVCGGGGCVCVWVRLYAWGMIVRECVCLCVSELFHLWLRECLGGLLLVCVGVWLCFLECEGMLVCVCVCMAECVCVSEH